MIALSPVVPIATVEKQFLAHVRSIAKHSLQHEPDCLAYFWLKSVAPGDNSVFGFEMHALSVPKSQRRRLAKLLSYANPDALAIVHRDSVPYTNFQIALRTEGLAPPPKPSDLIARHKVGSGFQTRSPDVESLSTSENLVIRSEYSNETEAQAQAVVGSWGKIVEKLTTANTCLGVQAFRDDSSTDLVIVERYTAIEDQEVLGKEILILRAEADILALDVKRTIWKTAGVGFIRHDA